MDISRLKSAPDIPAPKRILRGSILTAILGFVTITAVKAIQSPWQVDDFPEALAIKVELLPTIFPLHMISAGLALLLIPLAIALRPDAHRSPRWHRIVGRIAAFDVAIAGVTALPVALAAPVTRVSAAGFAAQGLTWLLLLALGIRHIRARRAAQHRVCMLLMAATASGAVFFRIYLALWAILGTERYFEAFYALDAWIAWLGPLSATAVLLKQTGSRNAAA